VVNEIPDTDRLLVKLFSGSHMDARLNETMNDGVQCKLPAREFLSSPDIPDQRFASVLGRRLFVSIATGMKEITVQQIFEENPDLALSYSRLRRILMELFTLVPEIGAYDRRSDNISLKTRIDYLKVQEDLVRLGKMSTREYKQALGMPLEEKRAEITAELKPTEQQKLEKYF